MKWKDFTEKQLYTEEMIENKKMPIFFDFYDYTKDFKNVYEPAEDTFLMIDCLNLEKNNILESFKTSPNISAEIGCGSGFVSCCLLSMLNENTSLEQFSHFLVDINEDCLKLSERLLKNYKLDYNVAAVQSNLFDCFIKLAVKLDLIIFNPPYVTTDEEELEQAKLKKDISASWAGGNSGSEVIYEFINKLESVINKRTVVYLLLSEENEYWNIIEAMKTKYGFSFQCLLQRKAKNENLSVFKFYYL